MQITVKSVFVLTNDIIKKAILKSKNETQWL